MKRTSLFVGLLGLLAACSGQKPWFEPRTEATARQQSLERLADHGIVLGIGTVTIPRGSAMVRTPDGKTRPVRSGDKIDNNETLETAPGSEAVITYADQSTYTLGPDTSVTVDQRNLKDPSPEGKGLGRRFELNRGTLDFDTRPNPAVQSSISSKDEQGNIVGIVEIIGSNGRTEAKGNSLSHTLDTGSTRMINPTVNIKIEISPGRSISFTMNFATQEVEVSAGGAAVGSAVGQIGNAAVQIEKETKIKLKRAEAEAKKAEKDLEKALKEQQKAIEKAQKEAEKEAEKAKKEAEKEAKKADEEAKKAEAEAKKAEAEAKKTDEAKKEAEKAEQEAKKAEQEAKKADDEFKKAEAEAKQAEKETQEAKKEAEKAEKQAEDQIKKAEKESQDDKDTSNEQKQAEKVNRELKKAELDAKKAEREAAEKKTDAEKKGDEQSKKEAQDAEKKADDLDKELKTKQGEAKGHEKNLPKRVGKVQITVEDGKVRVKKDGKEEDLEEGEAELDDKEYEDNFDEDGAEWGDDADLALLRLILDMLGDGFDFGYDNPSDLLTELQNTVGAGGLVTLELALSFLDKLREEWLEEYGDTTNQFSLINQQPSTFLAALAHFDASLDLAKSNVRQSFASNPVDGHFFAHAVGEFVHLTFHIEEDLCRDPNANISCPGGVSEFNADHSSFEADFNTFHNNFHNLTQTAFLDFVADYVHDRFHEDVDPGDPTFTQDHNEFHAEFDSVRAQIASLGVCGAITFFRNDLVADYALDHDHSDLADFTRDADIVADQLRIIFGCPR